MTACAAPQPKARSKQAWTWVFDAVRAEIFKLDPCITEEILKQYIAYKAETNFVDIIPQAKRLRINLNMQIADITDPRKICRDVSNVGHWGNGSVEVYLESENDLPYVISLIRQAFDQQMGEDEEDS